jgi:tetratricopeptide (TPR) repeat protein
VAFSSIVPVTRKAVALLLATAPVLPVHAQQPPPPAEASELASRALAEMEADRWEEALKLLTACVERHDARALERYGPSFGVTWYRKGICELRLKRWDAAAKSFETSYHKYPNPAGNGAGGNLYHKRALLRWGEAAQGAGKHEEAIRLFQKFLEERDKARDTFEPAPFYLNLAICHFRLGRIPEGIETLETAIQNKQRFRAPDSGIVAAFQALVEAAVAKREEPPLLSFLERNRAGIVIEPFEMEPYAGLFLKLAADALAAEMDAAALALLQLVPSSDVMTADLKSRLARLGPRAEVKELTRTVSKAALQASLDALARQKSAGEPLEVVQLGLIAVIHEKRGNLRGAHAVYRQLDRFFPKTAKREDHLFHAIRTGAALGEADPADGERFLKEFPNSPQVPAVRRMLLTALFQSGDYPRGIAVAEELLPRLGEGSADHDLALHVLGASQYHLGHHDAARPLLDRHVKTYPQSPQRPAALFFQASNLTRLRQWPDAAVALDRLLAEESGAYRPFALYERATCHLAEDQPAAALEKLDRLEKDFPDTEVLDAALALKGRILRGEERPEEAAAAYRKALAAASARRHADIAAESLWQLVVLLGAKPEAVAHADRFWKDHAGSPYRLRMAVAQLEALTAAGRGEEALARLRESITPGESPGMQEAIDRYAAAYATKHGLDALQQHFRGFPGIDPADKPARARLHLALIGEAEKASGAPAADRVKALYQELKSQFSPPDLTPAMLVRLGDFLRSHTSAPRQALPYYEETLARPVPEYHVAARFGRAAVFAAGSPEEKARALDDFKRIATGATDPALKDLAQFRIAETQLAAGDAGHAAETARQYLAQPDARLAAEAHLLLGEAYEATGKTDEALAAYRDVWTRWQDTLRLSAPAMLAWLDLATKEGKTAESLREPAMNYLARTKPGFDRWTEAERTAWQEIEGRIAPPRPAAPPDQEDKP